MRFEGMQSSMVGKALPQEAPCWWEAWGPCYLIAWQNRKQQSSWISEIETWKPMPQGLPVSSCAPAHKGSSTLKSKTTSSQPSVQTHDPMWDISHSKHNSTWHIFCWSRRNEMATLKLLNTRFRKESKGESYHCTQGKYNWIPPKITVAGQPLKDKFRIQISQNRI